MFKHVLRSSNYVYRIAGRSGRSESVLSRDEMLVYLLLHPIEDKLGVQLIRGI